MSGRATRFLWCVCLFAGLALANGCALLAGSAAVVCDLTPAVLDIPLPPTPPPPTLPPPALTTQPEPAPPQGAQPAPAATVGPEVAAPVKSRPPSAPAHGAERPPAATDDYIIRPLDTIHVEVFGEPSISRDYAVSAQGTIRHPLLDAVPVAGLSVESAERKLTDLLARDFFVAPKVDVTVQKTTGRRVTILGEITKPGTYMLAHDQPLSLLGVVALAGGFTDLADLKRVRILRDSGGDDNSTRVNVSDLLRGKLPQSDVVLLPGDVVVVPEAMF